MIRTIEAFVDEDGTVRLLEDVRLSAPHRALVTIFDEEPAVLPDDITLLSEATLADDWNRPEEDAAWSHLQPER
jgi:hypothetical protein